MPARQRALRESTAARVRAQLGALPAPQRVRRESTAARVRAQLGALRLASGRGESRPPPAYAHTSRRWHETRDIKYGIAGNGPVVVLAETGELVPLETHLEPEELVEEFERKRGLTG